jgi:hypothetical protein
MQHQAEFTVIRRRSGAPCNNQRHQHMTGSPAWPAEAVQCLIHPLVNPLSDSLLACVQQMNLRMLCGRNSFGHTTWVVPCMRQHGQLNDRPVPSFNLPQLFSTTLTATGLRTQPQVTQALLLPETLSRITFTTIWGPQYTTAQWLLSCSQLLIL